MLLTFHEHNYSAITVQNNVFWHVSNQLCKMGFMFPTQE